MNDGDWLLFCWRYSLIWVMVGCTKKCLAESPGGEMCPGSFQDL